MKKIKSEFSESMNDSNNDNISNLNINTKYANNYDNWRRKEEYQKSIDKFGKSLENSETESSSSEEEVSERVERGWLKAYTALKNKNNDIYDENTKYYSSSESSVESKKIKKKVVNLNDFERDVMMNKKGIYVDENVKGAYFEEQENLKNELVKESNKVVDSDSDSLFTINKNKRKTDEIKLSKNEQFLYDYLLKPANVALVDKICDIDDDWVKNEVMLDKEEEFEEKFNYRHEEKDFDNIKSFNRNSENTIRFIDNQSRKNQRERKLERKKQDNDMDKAKKNIKTWKKQIYLEKIEKIKKVSKIKDTTVLDAEAEYLEDDYDPKNHNQFMQKIFNDQYYQDSTDSKKPIFSSEDEFEDEQDKNLKIKIHMPDREVKLKVKKNKFEYRQVLACNFGLSLEEIFESQDKELNSWYPIKKIMKHRSEIEEKKESKRMKKLSKNNLLKNRLLPSLTENDEDITNLAEKSTNENIKISKYNTEIIKHKIKNKRIAAYGLDTAKIGSKLKSQRRKEKFLKIKESKEK
ncbi:hypothetical protein A3Q56_01294 [Intoshia linei]|uniref:Protein KRI1 homolog n=1 Tax=Intoshia linei TaxID=1819745 RepID=A0A177B9T1_9BILA|nr:hypothetical protein A3Q56_01294 [Intoshia linei]